MDKDDLIQKLFFLAIATFLYVVTSPNLWHDSYTAYFENCNNSKYDSDNCPVGKRLYTLSYRAIPESQVVVIYGVLNSPTKLTKCSVFDKKNWHCPMDTGTDITMLEGRLIGNYGQIRRLEYNLKFVVRIQESGRELLNSIEELSYL